ncbi:ATP-binding cassette domain-containing protein [Actinobaculum sp. 352]|uniref:ABC transporter ATP-binding protein n=1 Tax=Actinobaculum sp. 352 TaxID=2490946 RepID=UPI000F7F947F|nr:ATP-binding cassette domain-containing protein [Actinobaculum sp. 352]RTE48951.1 ATP-binding cassette domain-containing protein [Actinobaculum sp. 352]
MIRTTDLSMSIAGRRVFEPLSLECPAGSVTALTGASGSGKTTLLNCLGLLLRPTKGRISIDDEDASAWSPRRRRRFWQEKAAFIYQDYGLIDDETVDFNIRFTRPRPLRRRPRPDQRLTEVLTTVGLADRADDHAAVLSGGEKQRVGIARAIYKGASYIFADEPTASLDEGNRQRVAELLLDSAANGACVVLATHDEELAAHADIRYRLG